MFAVICSLKKWQLGKESSNCCEKIICSAKGSFSASWYLGDNFMWRKTKHNLQNIVIQIYQKVKCIYFSDGKQFLLLDTQTHQYHTWRQFLNLKNILRNHVWIISVKIHHVDPWEKIHPLVYLPRNSFKFIPWWIPNQTGIQMWHRKGQIFLRCTFGDIWKIYSFKTISTFLF